MLAELRVAVPVVAIIYEAHLVVLAGRSLTGVSLIQAIKDALLDNHLRGRGENSCLSCGLLSVEGIGGIQCAFLRIAVTSVGFISETYLSNFTGLTLAWVSLDQTVEIDSDASLQLVPMRLGSRLMIFDSD